MSASAKLITFGDNESFREGLPRTALGGGIQLHRPSGHLLLLARKIVPVSNTPRYTKALWVRDADWLRYTTHKTVSCSVGSRLKPMAGLDA